MYEIITGILPELRISQPATVVHGVYNATIERLIDGVFTIIEQHPEYAQNFRDARSIIEAHNIEWGDGENDRSMANVDVSGLDGQCIMALFLGLIRADRIWGCLSSFVQKGVVQRWIERLKDIDDSIE